MSNLNRNVHFLDAWGAGFFQNGSILYSDVSDFPLITPVNASRYKLFRCSQPGVPIAPLENHGRPVVMLNNNLSVLPGYYVILSSSMYPPNSHEVVIAIG